MTGGGERARLAREGIVVAAGHAATIAARLVGLRLLTSVVGPAVFGEANLLVGLVTLGTALFCAPVLQAVLRYFPDARLRGRVADLRRVALRLLVPGTAIVALLMVVVGAVWWALAASGPSLAAFVILAAIAVADVRRLFETNQLNAARRQTLFSVWVAADAWARPLGAVGLVALLGPSAASVLLGFAVGAFAVNETLVRFAGAVERPLAPDAGWERGLRNDLWQFVAPLVPLAILNWITSLSDRYILAGLAGTAVTGLYVAAYGLASQPFLAIANVGVTVFRPIVFEAVARDDAAKERRTIWFWLAVTSVVYAGGWTLLWLLAEPIVHVLLAEEYWGAATLVPWIGAAYALQGYQYVFETMLYARGATRRFLPLRLISAVASIVLYVALIPRWGAVGAAVATFVAFLASCTATVFFAGAPRTLLSRASAD